MTLEEKPPVLGLNPWHTKPVERLGIPSIMVTDGPHGLRKQVEVNDMGGLSELPGDPLSNRQRWQRPGIANWCNRWALP